MRVYSVWIFPFILYFGCSVSPYVFTYKCSVLFIVRQILANSMDVSDCSVQVLFSGSTVFIVQILHLLDAIHRRKAILIKV